MTSDSALEQRSANLVCPSENLLPGYVSALERGWTPASDRDPEGAGLILQAIRRDPGKFISSLSNPDGAGGPVTLADGTQVPRLPWVRYWISDGCGYMNFRWQRGTSELPDYCLGHVGYAVVPWKRGRGYAAQALMQLAPLAKAQGLSRVEISMSVANLASRRVVEKAGASLIETFTTTAEYDCVQAHRYRLSTR